MAFYDRFFRPVYQSAAAVVGNRDEAEEIMQDTLLKIFVRPELLNDDPQAGTIDFPSRATSPPLCSEKRAR